MTEWIFTAVNTVALLAVLLHLRITRRQIRGERGPIGPAGPAATLHCPLCKQRLKIAVLPHDSEQ